MFLVTNMHVVLLILLMYLATAVTTNLGGLVCRCISGSAQCKILITGGLPLSFPIFQCGGKDGYPVFSGKQSSCIPVKNTTFRFFSGKAFPGKFRQSVAGIHPFGMDVLRNGTRYRVHSCIALAQMDVIQYVGLHYMFTPRSNMTACPYRIPIARTCIPTCRASTEKNQNRYLILQLELILSPVQVINFYS